VVDGSRQEKRAICERQITFVPGLVTAQILFFLLEHKKTVFPVGKTVESQFKQALIR